MHRLLYFFLLISCTVKLTSAQNVSFSSLGGINDFFIPGGRSDLFTENTGFAGNIQILVTDTIEPYNDKWSAGLTMHYFSGSFDHQVGNSSYKVNLKKLTAGIYFCPTMVEIKERLNISPAFEFLLPIYSTVKGNDDFSSTFKESNDDFIKSFELGFSINIDWKFDLQKANWSIAPSYKGYVSLWKIAGSAHAFRNMLGIKLYYKIPS